MEIGHLNPPCPRKSRLNDLLLSTRAFTCKNESQYTYPILWGALWITGVYLIKGFVMGTMGIKERLWTAMVASYIRAIFG